MNTPILFLIFSRPDTTKQVFETIRAAQPTRLYIAADGPRESRGEKEAALCKKTRDLVIDNIDWDCEVRTLFRDENLGCGKAVSQALKWFFENEEMGIILEDDCLPHEDFFTYSTELLSKYKDNKDIVLIGGYSFPIKEPAENSYYFSAYNFIWGWAAWRRVLNNYNYTLENISYRQYDRALCDYGLSLKERLFLGRNFLLMKLSNIDTWDYQLAISCHLNKSLTIIPNKTLIQNIGFGEGATHTREAADSVLLRESQAIMPLKHPAKIMRDKDADRYYISSVQFNWRILIEYCKLLIKYLLSK